MNEIEIVNEYVERTGWFVDWCESCKIWAVHCPECGANHCGGGCDCGYSIAMERQQRKLDELSVGEMRDYIDSLPTNDKKYYKAKVEFHRRFSIPVACLALGLLAMPLGMQAKSARKSYGLVLGMVFFFLYFIMLSAGMVFGESGNYPPKLGMWLPNILMGSFGVYLLMRSLKEKPFTFAIVSKLGQFLKKTIIQQRKIS